MPSDRASARGLGSAGHVLLVSPLSFSYHLSISETLKSMGFQVTWWDERASSATWYKFALRFFPAATARWSETTFLNRLDRLPVASITHVLVIKGEGLSARIVNEMRKRMASASFGLYLWDGVENVKGVMNIFRFFDSVATFDPVDSKTFGWTYRPLFGRSTKISNVTPASLEFDWCFVGTIHSDRHKVMQALWHATQQFCICVLSKSFGADGSAAQRLDFMVCSARNAVNSRHDS
jgi:hypothetical protein